MNTVQLAIENCEYAGQLRRLLLQGGDHRVLLVEQPDPRLDGVIVLDCRAFQRFWSLVRVQPERVIVIAPPHGDQVATIWNAGVERVVFERDSPSLARLAIEAAAFQHRMGCERLTAVRPTHTGSQRSQNGGS